MGLRSRPIPGDRDAVKVPRILRVNSGWSFKPRQRPGGMHVPEDIQGVCHLCATGLPVARNLNMLLTAHSNLRKDEASPGRIARRGHGAV